MSRTETTTRTIFQLDELSDSAKEKAREWFRKGNMDHEWWDAVYDDAAQCAELIGIEIAPRGKYGREIWFSGFWSQGDGACFEGSYYFKADASKAIRGHASQDTELHRIADTLAELPHGDCYSASMKHRGHYYHSGCMSVNVEFDDEKYRIEKDDESAELPQAEFSTSEDIIIQAMRDFADWIYKQLETEYDYQNSDEIVDDSIRANEYEFTEDGERA